MSTKDRLTRKTEGLFLPTKSAATAAAPLRTGPGQMLMVNSLMKESNEKVALLEDRLKQFEGVLPVRLIEPDKIIPSKWANRDIHTFQSAEFDQLKEEIAQAGGNVQPIKVRPLAGDADRYEIVYGHRRHRASLDLNQPVLALVEDVSDKDLFKEMDRENRDRLDLSPWEQGMMYRQALNEKLFVSQENLSKELGVDAGNLSKALRLADLDIVLVNAFSSPLDLQYRWAKPLTEAFQKDRDGVLSRAKEATTDKSKRSAKEIFELLIGSARNPPTELPVIVNGKSLATVSVDGDRVSVKFERGALSELQVEDLHRIVKDLLHK